MNQQTDLLPVQLGEKFRLARLTKNLSRREVAQTLKLNLRILDWMENDQWDKLPQVYCQGYAKSYASLLGIDDSDTREQIKAISSPPPSLQPVFESRTKRTNMDRNLRVVTYAAASIFLVGPLIWVFTDKMAKLSQNEPLMPRAENSQPAVDGQSPAQPGNQPDHLQANVVPLAMLQSSSQAADPSIGQDLSEPVPNDEPLAAASPVVESQAQPIATVTDTPAENFLVLELNADSWVHITDAEGQRLEYDLLRGGSRHEYRGSAPFQLLIGRASAVQLELDGESIDLTEHASDNVASLIVEPGKISRG